MELKKIKKAVVMLLRKYLFPKDIINVIFWVGLSWFSMPLIALMFGAVNAPYLSMAHLTRTTMGLSVFGIILAGSWAMQRMFFPLMTGYFTDPDGDRGDLKSKFHYDLHDLCYKKLTALELKQCLTRLLLHLGFYFLWLLASILVVGLMF